MLNVLKDAQMASRRDEEIAITIETLQLSQNAINKNSAELAGQLIGRIRMHESATAVVVNQAKRMMESGIFDEQTTKMVEQLIDLIGNMEDMKDDKYPVSNYLFHMWQCQLHSYPLLNIIQAYMC